VVSGQRSVVRRGRTVVRGQRRDSSQGSVFSGQKGTVVRGQKGKDEKRGELGAQGPSEIEKNGAFHGVNKAHGGKRKEQNQSE